MANDFGFVADNDFGFVQDNGSSFEKDVLDPLAAGGYGIAQGLFMSWLDEALPEDAVRSLEKLRKENPEAYKTGNIAGAIKAPIFKILKGIKGLVTGSALIGAGEAEGDLEDKAIGAVVGAGTGLATAGVLKGLGYGGEALKKSNLVKKLRRQTTSSFGDNIGTIPESRYTEKLTGKYAKPTSDSQTLYKEAQEELGKTALKNDLLTTNRDKRFFLTKDSANVAGSNVRDIHNVADDFTGGDKLIDKQKLVDYLLNKAKIAKEQDKISLFNKLTKRAEMIENSPNKKLNFREALDQKSSAGSRGWANESSQIPKGDSAAVNRMEESWYGKEIKNQMSENIGEDIASELTSANREFQNLLVLGDMASKQVGKPSIAQQVLGNLTFGAAKTASTNLPLAGATLATRGFAREFASPAMAQVRQSLLNLGTTGSALREATGATLRGVGHLATPAARSSQLYFD